MGVESADDLAGFFDPAEHGTAAVYTPAGGAASTVNGIYSDGHMATGLGVLEASARARVFTCAASDVPNVAQGDALAIAGTTYQVADARPDGSGLMTLILEI